MCNWDDAQLTTHAVDKLHKAAFQWYEATMSITDNKLRDTFETFAKEFLTCYCCKKKRPLLRMGTSCQDVFEGGK